MLLSLAFLILGPAQQVQLKVTQPGNAVPGLASILQRETIGGGKFIELRLELHQGSKTVTIRRQSTFDPSGRCTRIVQDSIDLKGETTSVVVDISDSGAKWVELLPKREARSFPLAAGAPRAAASELWFWKRKPEVGELSRYYAFSIDAKEWTLTESRFVGQERLGSNGPAYNRVETTQGERTTLAWLDEKGMPIRIESGGTIFTRL